MAANTILVSKPARISASAFAPPAPATSSTNNIAATAPAKATQKLPNSPAAGKNSVTSISANCAPPATASVLSEASGLCTTCCSAVLASASRPPARNAAAISGNTAICTAACANGSVSGSRHKSAHGQCQTSASQTALVMKARSAKKERVLEGVINQSDKVGKAVYIQVERSGVCK